ncbi:MAG: SDR family NAD(P)-dependent oxidoreductase [Beijerinckiaceae bacterium]|nr:SDR family NAD(P)-dependent oxidoreductase [Beijerinckiaceae bacterium]MCI0735763.1 SDR family NAD(P)-dependent oxidoreductase [Beijerinckiaceae bacterium]
MSNGASHAAKPPVCAIAGAGPGSGAAFARKFAQQGYAVALLARQMDRLDALAKELPLARAISCDVTDPMSVEYAFAAILKDFGPVDTLIYNAGKGVWGSIEEIAPEDFESSWRTNAFGAFLAARQVIAPMKAAGHGTIVFIGATASRRGGANTAAFASAKAAQRSLAQSMARSLGPLGIHVALVVIDGVIDSPQARSQLPGKPDTFFIRPDAVAGTVYFLTKQEKSAWTFELEVRPFAETW